MSRGYGDLPPSSPAPSTNRPSEASPPAPSTASTRRGPAVRTYPQAVEAERSLLGSILQRPQVLDEVVALEAGDFYRAEHGALFELLVELWTAREPIDVVTVAERVGRGGHADRYGGVAYVVELPDHAPATVNAGHYAKLVANKAQLRRLLAKVQDLEALAYAEPDDVHELLDQSVVDLATLIESRDRDDEAILAAVIDESLERDAAPPEHRPAPLLTGYRDLDAKLTLLPGHLVALIGNTSHGKTATAVNLANGFTRDTRRSSDTGPSTAEPGAYFTFEVDRLALLDRLIGIESGVAPFRKSRGWLADAEKEAWAKHARALERRPMFVCDANNLTVEQLIARAATYDRRFRAAGWPHGLRWIVVDYLQLLGESRLPGKPNRERIVAHQSRSLKILARELDCVVIALVQPSRETAKATDKRPQLYSGRESGAIELDSDTFLSVYYHAKTLPDAEREPWRHRYEIGVLKQRNGPTFTADLHYTETTGRLRDLSLAEFEDLHRKPAAGDKTDKKGGPRP